MIINSKSNGKRKPDLREKYTILTYMRDLGLLDRYLA